MTRIDDLPENTMIERVNRILKNAEELRTTAQRFSSDSVLLYRGFSNNAYDIQTTNVGFNNKMVDITFTPTETVSQSLGGALFLTILAYISPTYTMATFLEGLAPTDGVGRWRLYLSGSDAFPIPLCQLKFYIFTAGTGTLTASFV